MVKTAVLVSGGGMNLQAIIDAWYFGELPGCELAAVISSNPEAYALTRAEMAGIPAYVVDADVFPNNSSFCNGILNKLKDLDIELVVLAGFDHGLEPALMQHYEGRIITVRPSLLPAFEELRDDAVHEQVLRRGAKITGATACFATWDGSPEPIIMQKAVPVRDDDTPQSLGRRVMEEAERELLPRTVQLCCAGKVRLEGGLVRISEE